ncbi:MULTISPECIES: RNA methyltransferase [unclassified Dysgonomonas]|jgi:tRNA G18 (ribose-2'-O)-methylase SpoU|uniref:RNA methyltransferase n=1 Tax=unclassified Dysgonomonas TaxID=2630389 RepID=UPI0025C5E5B7|nr:MULTISPECIES: RNA methyltransferase [unclassified Dysgonomonas]MDR2004009.1 RNA methyltransferase [Prevotella sp.]HMM02575.1 RNA methyltransferase [Dysgonomonas sp.]
MRVKKITELDRISIDEFKDAEKTPLIIILDNVRSLNNIGSVFRTSDAFLIESVFLCGITACPPNAEIHKTALGAENSLDWIYYEQTEDAVRELKNRGFTICAIEQAERSIMLDELVLDKTKKYAVILGNEVKGVRQEVVDLCDCCVEIPQYGTKHSLNVSVAAGIVIWEFFKQLG